ncbi:hypothetical protein FK178_13250 [Antarcticibacterium arcticum]|uniref:Uncharacterized protein n=1 Tax=Antarcticibacterium arcticum TaxID=2585771 RepID=A0A5B8YKV0_9FLAO|nr:hypothetical protein [Antarcticibacterium arcticum]QED38620.1 hypothetical protein FK178_13250 [Antarcticibacterium arcticum]
MKHQYLKILLLTFGIIPGGNITAQSSLQGNLRDWNNGDAVIAYFGMFNGEMTEIGSIKPDGTLHIPLDPDYAASFKKMAEKESAGAAEGWTMSYNTVSSVFPCMFEENIAFTNGDEIVTGLPEFLITDRSGETEHGYLYAVSSPEVAAWLDSYGETPVTKGYYLKWIYTDGPASATGECKMPTYTGNGEEMYDDTIIYDVQLEKGWNVLKYEIAEIFTSRPVNPIRPLHV